MNDDKRFDEIVADLYTTKESIATASQLVTYIKDPTVLAELELICSTMIEATRRFKAGVPPDDLPAFHLAVKQVKIMSDDLVRACTKKITIMA